MRKVRHKEVTTIFPEVTQWGNGRAGIESKQSGSSVHIFNTEPHFLCSGYFIFIKQIFEEYPMLKASWKTILKKMEKKGTSYWLQRHQHSRGVKDMCSFARHLWGVLSALRNIWFFIDDRRTAQMLGGLMTHFIRRAKLLKCFSIRRPCIWFVWEWKIKCLVIYLINIY